MMDTEAAYSALAKGTCSTASYQPTSTPPQTVAEPQPASDDDDEDDWFNKSLDEFDIPLVTNDQWSGEDEVENNENDSWQGQIRRTGACEASAERKSASDCSAGKGQRQKTTSKSENGSQESPSRPTSKAAGEDVSAVQEPMSSSDRTQQPADSSSGKIVTKHDTGVMLVLSFKDQLTTHFRLFVRHGKTRTADSAEQQADETGEEQDKEHTERTKQQGQRPEELSSAGGPVIKDEEPAEEREKTAMNRNSGKGQRKPGTQSTVEADPKPSCQLETSTVKRKNPEAAGKAGEGRGEHSDDDGGGGDDDDDGDDDNDNGFEYTEVRADEAPETLDEQWFQDRLKELPTLFSDHHVHQLSEARYQANLRMLENIAKISDNEEDQDDTAADFGNTTDQRTVHLLKSSCGDYNSVLMYSQNSSVKMEEWKPKPKPEKVYIDVRRCMSDNFNVVLKWLVGKRQEAETEACHLLRELPFSLVAMANLFFILWKKGERKKAAELQSHFMALKKWRPDIYEGIHSEELAELAWCYTELGPEFIPDALAIYEVLVPQKPHSNRLKWFWALNLRRLTNAKHTWSQPLQDVVTPLLKATDLLLEIIEHCEAPEERAVAAAELGEILTSCKFDDMQCTAVVQRAEEAGLDASKCFDIVMNVEDKKGSNLIRAGKHFRYSGQLLKSEKALKKAVSIQDSPKAHHQLALTLKKLAVQEKRRAFQNFRNQPHGRKQTDSRIGPRRGASKQNRGVISEARRRAGDSKMNSMSIAMKSVMYQSFSREDKYVNETMHHLNKTLMLSHGENCIASYDLGLMYKALREYSGALEQFLKITEIDWNTAEVVSAFEQAGLVNLEQCSLEENETRARVLEEEGKFMLTMAIVTQSRIAQQFRETDTPHAVWTSVRALGQYLKLQQEVEGVFDQDVPVEIWLLRLLRVYADTLPVLTWLQQITPGDDSPQVLTDRLNRYLRNQRYEDIILFTHLLGLTQQGQNMTTDYTCLTLKAMLKVAQEKLIKDVKAGLVGSTFNSSMAKRFFCWAFEDVHDNRRDTKHQNVSAVDSAQPAYQDWADDVEREEDSSSLDYQVLLVHDPRDLDAARFAQDVHGVLQKACRLKTHLPETGPIDCMQKATIDGMEHAHHLLFIIGCKEMSAELGSYIQHASARFPQTSGSKCHMTVKQTSASGVLSTLTFNDVHALPEFLQSRPALFWPDTSSLASHEFGRSVGWVESVCKLFGFLTGLDGTF